MTSRGCAAAPWLVVLALCGACGQERARSQRSATSTAPRAPAAVTASAPERPMANRREAQPFLDSAAVLLARGDTSTAVAQLHRAAALVQVDANQPSGSASGPLLALADRIDRFAGGLARRDMARMPSLAHISALLNLAEANRHLALASVACSTRSRESIYDELTMALDHVERAARDGRIALAPPTRNAIAEVRQVAAPLATECARDLGPLDDAIATLQREVARMRRALDVQ